MRPFLIAIAALCLCAPAFAQPVGGVQTAPDRGGRPTPGSMVVADGEGIVTSVDAKAGTVTIHHSPIAALNWPAMTMPFKAMPPSILKGVKVGQAVTFRLMQMGGSTTLTAIQPK